MPSIIQTILNWVLSAANVGGLAAAAFVARWLWNRWRWTQFRMSLRRLGGSQPFLGGVERLKLKDWRTLAAMQLSDAEFTPSECLKLLNLATDVAIGEASLTFWWYHSAQSKNKGN